MQSTIRCKNCNTDNPFFQLTCRKCSAYLRERIFNIDLWEAILQLIEAPSKAYTKIIYAEHKNFISFIFLFTAVKLSINAVYMSLALSGQNLYFRSSLIIFLISTGLLLFSISFSSLAYTLALRRMKIQNRFRDNLSITIYSFMPYVFGLVLLFPIELILFGYTVFSVNPPPFIIKPTLTYIMLGFEVLFIGWSFFLAFMAYRKQAGGVIIPLVFTLLLNIIIYLTLYIFSKSLLLYEI